MTIFIVQKTKNFDKEVPLIKEVLKTDYSLHFINNVINVFQKGKDHGDESFIIIPPDLCGITFHSYPLTNSTVNSMKVNQNIF